MARAEQRLGSPIRRHTGWLFPLMIFLATSALSAIVLIYYFVPAPQTFVERQPLPTADSRIVRLVVHKTLFSIPSNYLVYDRSREGGEQEDVALFAALPDLAGYSAARAQEFTSNATDSPIVYLLIREDRLNLSEAERLKRIYLNYVADEHGTPGPFGLTQYAFRNDSGYRGEDLFVGQSAHGLATLRCVRFSQDVPSPSCLRDLPVAHGVALSYRFKRAYLAHWSDIATRVEALMLSFRAPHSLASPKAS